MLNVQLVDPADVAAATTIFNRDGFVAIRNALTAEQLTAAQVGAQRVIAEQTARIKLEEANRGFARYSFGQQVRHPEWQMLIDLPTISPLLEAIWQRRDYQCGGAGGDYSVPGAKIQHLHSDTQDFLRDPLGQTNWRDLPVPFIVVNFLMVDFTRENGAIRFVPGTQRSRHAVPTLDEEPAWMRDSILCAPAGTAVVRDVRCWHGGTANQSQQIRPMVSSGFYAPWFRGPLERGCLPRESWQQLPERARELTRDLVEWA